MRRLLSTVVTLAWALWFGGMIVLFIAVGTIFGTLHEHRGLAGDVASALFRRFEVYQLALAAAALLATFAWWLADRSRLKIALFALFALAAVAAVLVTTRVSPRIEGLRARHASDTPEFARLHHTATRVYTAQAAVLLVAGMVLPAAVRDDPARRGRSAGLDTTAASTPAKMRGQPGAIMSGAGITSAPRSPPR